MGIVKKIITFLLLITTYASFSQEDEYYRRVDWKFYPSSVVQLTDSTYQLQAIPYDYNDPGAIQRIVGNYVVDFVGHRYQVIDSTSTTITVLDIYHTGQAPQSLQIARCYRSVGNGEAEFIGSVDYSPLDESARWKLNGSDNELLWKTIKSATSSNHADLTNLGWSASNHTDGINTIAAFNSTGAAITLSQNSYIKNQTASYQPASFKIRGIGDIDSTFNTSTALSNYAFKITANESNGNNSSNLISLNSVATHSGSIRNSVVVGVDGRANLTNAASSNGLYGTSGRVTLSGSSTITGSASAFYGYTTNSSSSVVPWVIGAQNYVALNGTNSTTNVRGVFTDIYNNSASAITNNATVYTGHLNNNSGGTIAEAMGTYNKINNVNGTIDKARGSVFDISTGNSGRTKQAVGVLIGEWETTGIVDTSYALRIDNTVDAGTIKYAIRSESTSDSKLDGDLILSKLSGITTRLVTADNSGKLSTTLDNSARWNQHITNDLDTVIGNEYQNITYQRYSDKGIMNISNGVGDTIPLVDNTYAGLMSPYDKIKLGLLDSIVSTNGTVYIDTVGNVIVCDTTEGAGTEYEIEYGLLYNWYAATDIRNITSSNDWVVSNVSSHLELMSTIGESTGGKKIKEIGLLYWNTPNSGTNEVGFNMRGGGWRTPDTGEFSNFKNNGYILTSTEFSSTVMYSYINPSYNSDILDATGALFDKKTGMSIRLVYVGAGTPTEYVGNDGKRYPVVLIGTQRWISMNLAETKYRNGDPIPEVTDNAAWTALTTGALCAYNNDWGNAYTAVITGGITCDTLYTSSQIDEMLLNIEHNLTINKDGGDSINNYYGHVTEAQQQMLDTLGNYLITADSTLLSHNERITILESEVSDIDTLFYIDVAQSIQSVQLGDTLQSLAVEQPDSTGQIPTWNQDSAFFETIHNINDLEPKIVESDSTKYWRGDKTWQPLNTSIVPELTNLYYTDTRARNAFSLTTTGNSGAATYSNSTGVFNIPNYTLAGLGGQPQLNGTGFVKASGTTITYDNSTYLTEETDPIFAADSANMLHWSDTLNMTKGIASQYDLVEKVTGPASSTDNAIARFDGTTGKLIQNSGVILNDNNIISSAGIINAQGISDLNVNTNSYYSSRAMYYDTYNSSALNKPFSGNNANGVLTLVSYPSEGVGAYGKQIAFGDNNNLYIRRFSNGTFENWVGLYHSGNSNLSTVNWAANNITAAGTIQGTTAKLTNLTDGYLPYHVSDASGLANSNIFVSGSNVGINTTTLSYGFNLLGSGGASSVFSATTSDGLNFVGYRMANTGGSFAIARESSTGSSIVSGSSPYAALFHAVNAYPMQWSLNGSIRMTLMPTTGNFLIATTTDNATDKLQVNGSILGTTAKLTNLTDNYIPKHTSDATGLENSNIFFSGNIARYGTANTFSNDRDIIDKAYVDAIAAGSLNWSDTLNLTKGIASKYDLTNYYTKTNLQTSGQSSVHWGNITNKPISTNVNLGSSNDSIPSQNAVQMYVNNAISSIVLDNDNVQVLTGTTPVWNVNNGLNAKITLTGATTITMQNLSVGKHGSLTVTNGGSTSFYITFAGYTFKVHTSIRQSANTVVVSGGTTIDHFSWYYDGTNVIINGGLNFY